MLKFPAIQSPSADFTNVLGGTSLRSSSQERVFPFGAGNVTRTPDLLITNQLLYRLSYTSVWRGTKVILAQRPRRRQGKPKKYRGHYSLKTTANAKSAKIMSKFSPVF